MAEVQGVSHWPGYYEVTLQLCCTRGVGWPKELLNTPPGTTFYSPGSGGHRGAILQCSEMLPAHLAPSLTLPWRKGQGAVSLLSQPLQRAFHEHTSTVWRTTTQQPSALLGGNKLSFWGTLTEVGCCSCSHCIHPSFRHCLLGALSLGPTTVSYFPIRV